MLDAQPQYLNATRLARKTGLPISFIRQEAKAGRLPHLKTGRGVLFNPLSVAEELKRREREALTLCAQPDFLAAS